MNTSKIAQSSVRDAVHVLDSEPLCIEFLLDETGSMSSCRNATVGGFNDYLNEQKSVTGECLLTLTKFEGGNLVTPYQDLDIGLVPEMTDRMFVPKGGTNLFDAIGDRIMKMRERMSSWDNSPKVLFVVMTDGGDNASYRYDSSSIKELVTELEATERWTFVYLGANQNALQVGAKMGFSEGNIRSFETAQMRETMNDLSRATTVYRASGDATKNFF